MTAIVPAANPPLPVQQIKSFTIDLSKAAGTYDLCTANLNDCLVQLDSVAFYCTVAGATFTSVSVQSNQTTPAVLLSSTEGAVANLTAGKNISRNIGTAGYPALILRSGDKIQYTLIGATGTGTLIMDIVFYGVNGANLN